MLLLLTLAYLFNGFQTQAMPLSNLFAESGGNATTIASISPCVCPADQRSIWDILWSSLATIFACSWVSIHPNIPAPNESWWRVFLRRLELMFWAVVGPELLISWAFRQWLVARRLEKLYKERGWTRTHGYFIQMGGFMLFEGKNAKGVLSSGQFSELLKAKKIEFPTITVEEIEDRSKGDGFSKTLALGQTLWFIAQCIARRAQHLDITLVELLTLSLAVLNGVMYFLWWHKPLDVRYPVRVYLLDKPDEPNKSEVKENLNPTGELDKPNEPSGVVVKGILDPANELDNLNSNEPGKTVVSENLDRASGLDKPKEPGEASDSKSEILDFVVYSLWKSISSKASSAISEKCRQMTIVWQSSLPISSKVLILISWNVVILALLIVTFPIILFSILVILSLFPVFRWASILVSDEFHTGDMKVPTFYSSEIDEDGETKALLCLMSFTGVVFGGIHCAGWFFIFPSNDEAILWRVCSVVLTGIAFLLPFLVYLTGETSGGFQWSVGIPAIFAFLAYALSRLLLLVEAFISLRHLTPGMLAIVKWTSFIPHI